MPLKGFLGPSSETADLTRILRRYLANKSIPHFSATYKHPCILLQIIQNSIDICRIRLLSKKVFCILIKFIFWKNVVANELVS